MDGIRSFYETDPALTIFVGILIILAVVMILACSLGFCCRRCNRGKTYYIAKEEKNYRKKYDDNGWSYESFEMRELPDTRPHVSYQQAPVEPNYRQIGTRVMFTDEAGRIPPYTLRTRSQDGSVEKYTTYYNIRPYLETDV